MLFSNAHGLKQNFLIHCIFEAYFIFGRKIYECLSSKNRKLPDKWTDVHVIAFQNLILKTV